MRFFQRSRHSALVTAIALAGGFAANAGAAEQQPKKQATSKQATSAAAAPAAAPAPSTGVMGYGVKMGGFFNDQHKQVARKYFTQSFAKAKDCPEGLERAGKTCKAPVEGRYWVVGQALQKAVKPYPVPEQLVAQLPPAPQGYEYVRAGEDILLVSKGMHLVVDILPDVIG